MLIPHICWRDMDGGRIVTRLDNRWENAVYRVRLDDGEWRSIDPDGVAVFDGAAYGVHKVSIQRFQNGSWVDETTVRVQVMPTRKVDVPRKIIHKGGGQRMGSSTAKEGTVLSAACKEVR